MSSVKRLLRSARECLGRKEYREALQHCKEALAEDKSCYEAYVFVGKAAFSLGEAPQAQAAYRRAADLDPANPLAWQGLAELAADTGAWSDAAEAYAQLLALADAAPPQDAAGLRSRRPAYLRRHAEAAARAGQLVAAEASWRALVEAATEAHQAAAAAAGGGGEAAAAALAAAEEELVECLCRLADVQLAADTEEIEARVAVRLAEEAAALAATTMTPEQAAALEAAVRGGVEGEWAEEALEADADHASASLRAIIALRPPAPPYVNYYNAFLKRLRKYIQAAAPGSMDRHARRAVLLAAAKATMEGRCGDRAGGCCDAYPYEAALAMLEVEHQVAGAEDPSLDPASPGPSPEPPQLPLLLADCRAVTARLAHAFPAAAAAQLHWALALRRRAAAVGFDWAPAAVTAAATAEGEGGGEQQQRRPAVVVRLPPAGAGAGAGGKAVPAKAAAVVVTANTPGARRRQIVKLLLSALSRGARGVAGWLAACELLLEEGAEEAALDAAKEGLKLVAHRELVGKERMGGAGLLLRLLAGQALLRLRKLEEAQLLLEGLAHGVSEGHVAAGELAGLPPVNVSQQAKRLLAHVAAARGDLAACRHVFEELVGGQLMGRSAAPIEAWAHGELGMLLLRMMAAGGGGGAGGGAGGGGTLEGARHHLQCALAALAPALEAAAAAAASPAAAPLQALQREAATYHLHLALALWAKGGGSLGPAAAAATAEGAEEAGVATAEGGGVATAGWAEPYRSECREHLLSAAAVAGPLQAAAFTWLGHWYVRAAATAGAATAGGGGDAAATAGADEAKARKCYQRALALDPAQAEAGEALVRLLRAAGRTDTALGLAAEMAARLAAAASAAAAAATAAGSAGAGASAAGAAGVAPSPFLVHPRLLQLPADAAGAAAGGTAGVTAAGGAATAVGANWALRCLARLQRDTGASEAAVSSYQSALRLSPDDAELWEGLASAYQALGRHTAALKSYGRALDLAPGRLYCRLQAAALSYQMGDMPAALAQYRTALAAPPAAAAAAVPGGGGVPAPADHPAALLGCGEVLLAQAAMAARMGAAGAAAAELAEAEALAARAAQRYGNMQAAWKLLGDVRMQHAAVPTAAAVAASRESRYNANSQHSSSGSGGTDSSSSSSSSADAAVAAALEAARARLAALRAARRAYAAALHLEPGAAGGGGGGGRAAGLWGDMALGLHLEAELAGQHPALAAEAGLTDGGAALRRRALALARGGLRLDPTSDWLWGCAATIAAAAASGPLGDDGGGAAAGSAERASAAATAEYCYSRALQLNPRRAPLWAALGRLYAAHGEGALASRCFDSARSHEPTSIAVWEAMGDAALRRAAGGAGGFAAGGSAAAAAGAVAASPAWRDAADAYEHAQLLGGDVESRLGFALGSLLLRHYGGSSSGGGGAEGAGAAAGGGVLAAATKAAAMQPLLPAAHHARGLALEARGDFAAAAEALQTALSLLDSAEAAAAAAAAPSAAATPSPRPQLWPADADAAPSPRLALQADLARVLAAAPGRAAEAVAAHEALRAAGLGLGENGGDAGLKMSYAMALVQAGRADDALPHLADVMAAAAASPLLRLAAATAAVRIHVAARRWDEMYGVVLAATSDLPDEGRSSGGTGAGAGGHVVSPAAAAPPGAAAEAAAKLWRVALAGLVAARAPELERELLGAMRQWSAGRRDLNAAQHECRVAELLVAKSRAAAAAGGDAPAAVAALRQAARAVHACPSDRPARSLLAHTALLAGPRYAAAAARAAPRDTLPHDAAADPVLGLAAPPSRAPLAPSAAAVHAAAVAALPAAAAASAPPKAGAGPSSLSAAAARHAAERMRRVVHAQPHEAAAWYLCALTEAQAAAAAAGGGGGAARCWRRVAVAAAAAAARAQAGLASRPEPPPPGAAGGAPPRPPPGLPPAMAMVMAAQAARAHAPADPRVLALRAQRGSLADVAVRALAVLSEAQLQLHLRSGAGGSGGAGGGGGATATAPGADALGRALEAAKESLRVAGAHAGTDASPAHRAAARLAVVTGDNAAADAAYEQACRTAAAAASAANAGSGGAASGAMFTYQHLPALEWAAVRAAAGDAAGALQRLQQDGGGSSSSGGPGAGVVVQVAVAGAHTQAALEKVAAVQRALLLLESGQTEAARAAAAEAAAALAAHGACSTAAAPAAAAALSVQAAAALVAAVVAEGDAAARKKHLLEARWAAREALKPLSVSRPAGALGVRRSAPPPGPDGPGAALASLLLARAEAAMGRPEASEEAQRHAERLWPPSEQAGAAEGAAAAGGGAGGAEGEEEGEAAAGQQGQRLRLGHEVHSRPWELGGVWAQMAAAARS